MAVRELFVLNELTLLPFLWRCFTGRKPMLAAVLPLLRLAGGPLRLLAARLRARGMCRPASEFSERLRWSENMPEFGWYNDIHITVEERLHTAFNPAPRTAAQGWYAYAAKKAVTDALADLTLPLLVVEWAERNLPAGEWRVRGLPPMAGWIYRAYWGRAEPFDAGRPALASRLFNLLNLIGFLVTASVWLAVRVRRRVVLRTCTLAVDAHTELEATVLRRLLRPGESGVAVFRSGTARAGMAALFDGYPCLTVGDARITPRRALALAARLVADLAAHWRLYGGADPELFGRLGMLAAKRCMWDAFFDGVLPANFWCRDDYALDHTMRNKVLRDRGGRSLGINHGIPIAIYFHAYREIDCDTYFVHGDALVPHYRPAWPENMVVRAIGTVHQPAPDEAPMPGRRDIVVFATVVEDIPWLMAQIRALADAFPDRRVWVRTKTATDADFMEAVDRLFDTAPANLVRHREPEPYGLMRRCGHAVSTGSTAALEAIAFGMTSFVLDVWPRWERFYFRKFPQVLVADAVALAARIRGAEDGGNPYPFAALQPLIRQGVDPFAEIRKEMTGLGRSSIVPPSQE